MKAIILEANILNVMVFRALNIHGSPFSFDVIKKTGNTEPSPYIFNFQETVTFYRKQNSLGLLIKQYIKQDVDLTTAQPKKFQFDVALFVPESGSLEGIDAVLVDRVVKKVFLIQITSNIQNHDSKKISKKRVERENIHEQGDLNQSSNIDSSGLLEDRIQKTMKVKTDVKFKKVLEGKIFVSDLF